MKALSIRLCILGLLLEEDLHPYEIMVRMRERFLDHEDKFKIGSLYYAVDQLAKQSYIEAVETIHSTSKPDKTVYRITDSGKEHFHKLLLDRFKEDAPVYNPLHIVLVFASRGDQEKIAEILRERIREVEFQVDFSLNVYKEHQGLVPRSVLHLMAGQYEHAKTELKWLKRLLADTEAGRLGDTDSASLMDQDEI